MTQLPEMTQSALVADLQAIVGPEHARAPDPRSRQFVIDGIAPTVVVMPGTYEEAAASTAYASQRGLALIPQCEGRVTWIGNIPARYDIALSVSRLNQVTEYEPADLTITCQAGAKFDDGYPPLESNGQSLPVSSVSCVGRSLALPMRGHTHAGDYARDYTIGLRVITAEGRIIRTGGKVVKNVAGYDLTKLFIGSMGTLGVIVEATFKLTPVPSAEERVWLEFKTPSDACRFASELRRRGLSLSSDSLSRPMSLSDAGSTPLGVFRLLINLAGSTGPVARSQREIRDLLPSAQGSFDGTRVENPRPLPAWTTAGDPLTCGITVIPTEVPALIEAVDDEAPGAFIEGSALSGQIAFTWLGVGPDADLVRRVRAITTRLGGSCVVTGCDPELKRQIDVFGDPPPAFDLMRRIKQQFDPNGILSPGRFVGRL